MVEPLVLSESFGGAAGVCRVCSGLDHGNRLVGTTLTRERRLQCRPLRLRQIAQLLDKSTKILGFHGTLHPMTNHRETVALH